MVAGMSDSTADCRRAKRLLLWYPRTWRERYGEEFVDHLEQEFTEKSVDFRRTVNIASKGLVARVGDFGFSNATLSPEGQTRAAVGTSFVLLNLAAVVVLNFWSLAMLRWSGRTYHPIPVSATTGILTVVTGLMLLVLVAIVLIVVSSTGRQIRRGQFRRIAVPSVLAAASGALLLYAVRSVPYELYLYAHGYHGRPGIGWTQPGSAITALAQTTFERTQGWVSPWNQPHGNPTSSYVVNDLVPIAVLLFGISIASLWRRVELPRFVKRFSSATVSLLGVLTSVFLVAYLFWIGFGGPSGDEAFVPEGTRIGYTYLVALGIFAILVGRTRWLARIKRDNSTLTSAPQF